MSRGRTHRDETVWPKEPATAGAPRRMSADSFSTVVASKMVLRTVNGSRGNPWPALPHPQGWATLPPLPAMVANLSSPEQTKAAGGRQPADSGRQRVAKPPGEAEQSVPQPRLTRTVRLPGPAPRGSGAWCLPCAAGAARNSWPHFNLACRPITRWLS